MSHVVKNITHPRKYNQIPENQEKKICNSKNKIRIKKKENQEVSISRPAGIPSIGIFMFKKVEVMMKNFSTQLESIRKSQIEFLEMKNKTAEISSRRF